MDKLSDAEQQRLRPIVPALRGLSALQRGGRGLATAPSRLRRAASLPFLPSIQLRGLCVDRWLVSFHPDTLRDRARLVGRVASSRNLGAA
ncbi:hypothetical protein AK812_SmicGene15209 [Symbiodinium microadriaticum]|uniref:Uncharacterized protein n=1 Tax=Symbiodinium microadriaticum TaxID=2951 RepID=A0A1Q9E3G8_SYMMI|nr:hypothetical protein AK812_SmicGene15209 [Symbiodinium microadriaticum]